jgi:hypothetical protein
MALKPEVSLSVGLSTAALVYAVYSNATPPIADIRVAKPNDVDIESSRKLAAWTSAGVVGGISLIAKDPTVFILGGTMVVILDWWHRHANMVNPITHTATSIGDWAEGLSPRDAAAPPPAAAMADYAY